jgi:hypothetical protein
VNVREATKCIQMNATNVHSPQLSTVRLKNAFVNKGIMEQGYSAKRTDITKISLLKNYIQQFFQLI